ncbi:hypothetical protein LUZ61_005524 [Rhynchospora tenuis]|uniref:Leucine-rich repeat-containing N-terminal plant-type domain-containing protein n=1 Tax=Rhynchospora tenuis TaxID=198213 RepID=A0AAD5ZQ39_9POAL|nr:hypothetical protein LUZ61_005524 [Rhynchospora tenuis]
MTKIKNIPSALFSFWVLLLTQASTLATNEENTRVNNSCLPGERAALLTLKAGFVDPKHRLSSWEGYDCCSWSGVTCSNGTGHVVKLDLSNTYMTNDSKLYPFPDFRYALGGEIRSSLLSLRYLNYLDLSYNNFSYAKIPHFIGSLEELWYLNLSYSYIGGRMPPQLEVDTKGELIDFLDFISFDLSGNNLVGNIPEEIGALDGLINLNLSRNKLSGFIPRSIGNLRSLESLDFSNNELSGSIPSSLADLTFLSHLNMSYNNLSGRIPSGRQLQTLNDQSIYEGNNDLCGFPLPIECSGSKITSQSFVFENKNSHEFYVGAIIGFAVGAWMVYAALLFNKSWRVAYFVFFDNMYDRLYQNYAEIKKKPVTRKMY